MSGTKAQNSADQLVFEYAFEASPEKVWRAVSMAEFPRKWLPDGALADPEPVSSIPGQEIRYRMLDEAPPFLESVVTFQIQPGTEGGTLFRIIHQLTDSRVQRGPGPAANSNGPPLMQAA